MYDDFGNSKLLACSRPLLACMQNNNESKVANLRHYQLVKVTFSG